MVDVFLMPAETGLIRLHWALGPILVAGRGESIAGREERLKGLLFIWNCPSVIGMTFVAMYSLISALIVSMMGKREMVDLPFLKVPIQTPYATLSSDGECMLGTSLG